MKLCNCSARTLAFAAMSGPKLKGSRSTEAVELTNAQALAAVIIVALAEMTRRLTVGNRMTLPSCRMWLVVAATQDLARKGSPN